MKQIKLMADYGCYPLWNTGPDEFGDIDPSSLPISKKLQDDLIDWAARFDAILNKEDPVLSNFKSEDDQMKFIMDGSLLAKKLKEELSGDYEIIYHSSY